MNLKFQADKDEDGDNFRKAAMDGLLNPDGIVESLKTLIDSLGVMGYRAQKIYRRGDGYVRVVLSLVPEEAAHENHH